MHLALRRVSVAAFIAKALDSSLDDFPNLLRASVFRHVLLALQIWIVIHWISKPSINSSCGR
ncbi:MAG TPA: hypothetical protein VGO59_14275, partial [Verrucomicrobiae bacterium]